MIIYQLIFHSGSIDRTTPVDFIDLPGVSLIPVDGCQYNGGNSSGLEIDPEFMPARFGYPITPAEIACFSTHRHTWELFEAGGHEWCLIIEDNAQSDIPFSAMETEITALPQGWDVCSPAARPVLPYFWGSYAYFLSRNGAQKLLKIPKIRQPVEIEMLQLTHEGSLNTVLTHRSFFHAVNTPSSALQVQKDKVMKDTFDSLKETHLNVWTLHHRTIMRDLLSTISTVAQTTGCNPVLDSGSLLGHVRHGGIIPWDDDADLGMEKSQIERFLKGLSESGTVKWAVFPWEIGNSLYYKIWSTAGDTIEPYDYKYPFVEIWPYTNTGEKIIFDEGRVFDHTLYYPLKKTLFEGSILNIPADPQGCLDRHFEDWRTNIRVYPWRHRFEKESLPPLKVRIETDAQGRLITV